MWWLASERRIMWHHFTARCCICATYTPKQAGSLQGLSRTTLSKEESNGYNGTITMLWKMSSDAVSPESHSQRTSLLGWRTFLVSYLIVNIEQCPFNAICCLLTQWSLNIAGQKRNWSCKRNKVFSNDFWGASKAWENKPLTYSKLGSLAFLVTHHEQETVLANSWQLSKHIKGPD